MIPYIARTAEMAVRLATVRAVGGNPEYPAVAIDDMVWGRDVAKWSAFKMAAEAGDFIQDNPVGRIWAKIVRKVASAPGGRLAEREVMRAFAIPEKEMKEHARNLEITGGVKIEIIVTQERGGKTSRYLSIPKRRQAA